MFKNYSYSHLQLINSNSVVKFQFKWLILISYTFFAAFITGSVNAATAGIPFTEDFTNNDLLITSPPSAQWNERELSVLQAFRQSVYGGLQDAGSLVGSSVGAQADNTRSIVIGDVDGDGDLDVVVGNNFDSGQPLSYFPSNGSATPFSDLTRVDFGVAAGYEALELADVDNDGDLDLVAGINGLNQLFINSGSAATPFSSSTNIGSEGENTIDIAIADMDGDGLLDVVTGSVDVTNKIYYNNGTTDPYASDGISIGADTDDTRGIAVGDVDGDGDMDVVSGNRAGSGTATSKLYLNEGSPNFLALATAATISADVDDTRSIALSDMDNDGDLDVVVGNDSAASKLYLNDGLPDLFTTTTANSIGVSDSTRRIVAVDVNQDGNLDIVTANAGATNKVYINNGTVSPFDAVTAKNIGSATDNSYDLAVADIDNDGDMDIIDIKFGTNLIYFNNASTNPFLSGTSVDVDASANKTASLAIADIDGDGDLDIVTGNLTRTNEIFFNDGDASPFSSAGQAFGDAADNTYGVALGDVDQDGDIDVVTANFGKSNKLYLNDGTGSPYSGTAIAIGVDTDNSFGIALDDFNGDSLLDVVAINFDQTNKVYINDGDASPFSAAGIEVDTGTERSYSVATGDVDGDGDIDIVTGNAGTNSDYNRLYLNNGSGTSFTASNANTVTELDDTYGIGLADMDGDGDLDLVTANNGTNRLHLNDGSSTPFTAVADSDIGSESEQANNLDLVDVDQDGDIDVIVANHSSAGSNRLYLNNGTATPFTNVDSLSIGSETDNTNGIISADMDGDGDFDVVAGNFNTTNRLYLNEGTFSAFGVPGNNTIGSDTDDTNNLAVGDVDRDGDLDVVAGNHGSTNKLYLNNGSSAPFSDVTGTDIGIDSNLTLAVALADMDGDGDLDMLEGNDGTNRLYLNDGVADPFDTIGATDIGSETDTTKAIAAGDINQDGNLDVITGNSAATNKIYFHDAGVNADPFDATTISAFGNGTDDTTSLVIADIDHDGRLDTVTGTVAATNKLYIHDNDANPYSTALTFGLDTDDTYALAVGDMDRDGDLDVVIGNDNTDTNKLYLNDESGNPYDTSVLDISADTDNTRGIALMDMNQDGNLDVVVANSASANKIYYGEGDADPFTVVVKTEIDSSTDDSRGVLLSDVDRDGRPDVLFASSASTNTLLSSVKYNTSSRQIESLKINDTETGITRAKLTPTVTSISHSNVNYYLSNDAGAKFHQVTSGEYFTFPSAGTDDLRWKAELSSISPLRSARLSQVDITTNDAPVFDTSPTINEVAPVVNDTLTLTYAVSDPNAALGDTVISPQVFKWYAVGEEGTTLGTEQTYTLTATEAHKTIRCDVTATDSLGASTTESTPGLVVENTSPVAVDDTLATQEDVSVGFNTAVDLVNDDTDEDNDGLTVTSVDATSTAGGTITPTGGGNYTYTPFLNFVGTDTFDYIVDDGNGGTDTGTVTVTMGPINDAPEISGIPATTVLPGNSYSFTPTTVEVDVGDILTFSIANKPVWADFDTATGALTSTPVADNQYGPYNNIIISVTDSVIVGTVDLPAFSINVLDETVPTASSSRATGDYNINPLDVLLSCSDAGSGPGQILYTTSGGIPSITYTGTLFFASDTNLDFRCFDIAGNVSSTASRSYNIDLIDPVPAIDIPGGAYPVTQNISLSCSDTDSGPDSVYFTINGPDPVIGTPGQLYGGGPIPVSVDSTVKLVCADNAGNVADIVTEVYVIDADSPTISADIPGGPYNATQNVTLTCVDTDSGPGTIFYTDDGSDPVSSGTVISSASPVGPLAVTTNTQLRFYCDDLAGNSSTTGSEIYVIDLVDPVNGASPAAGAFSSAQNVTLSCNDELDGSGAGAIYYTLDGSLPTTASTEFAAPIGIVTTTTIRHFCQDLAGNSSDIDDRTYIIDEGAPSVLITAPLDGDNFNALTSITGTASDNNAVASVEVEITGALGSAVVDSGGGVPALNASALPDRIPAIFAGGNWSLAIPFAWTPDVYTVTAHVTDDAANTSFVTVQFSINRVPTISGAPSVTSLQPGVAFSFTPISDDADLSFGDTLSFSIENQPGWITEFDPASGQMTGTPGDSDFGTYPNIILTVTDEFGENASLGSFTLDVIDITQPVPVVDDPPGSYNSNPGAGIELSCLDSGSMGTIIFFSTDGSEPTTDSAQYTDPIVLDSDLTIKYFCQDAAGNESDVVTLDYVFDIQPPVLNIINPAEGDFINEMLAVTGTVTDDDNVATVELEMTGASGTALILSGGSPVLSPGAIPERIPATVTGENWQLLTPGFNSADDFTITVYATDDAGNESTVVRNFTFFLGSQSFTTLTLETSAPSILNGESIDITGKLTRLPDDGTTIPAGREIALTVTDPDGIETLFTTGTYTPEGHYKFLASDGNAISGFTKKGAYSLSAYYAGDAAFAEVTSDTETVLVGTSAGYALVVQGKIDSEEGLESHNKTTNRIYNTLINRGFDPANILYYNYDDTQPGVDGLPAKTVVQNAIENLLPDLSSGVAAPVYIFMVDHGSPDLFHIGADTISASEFDSWMTTMESNFSTAMQLEKRFLVYGACYSGSYISTVSKPGRVIVASAAADEESYKGPVEDDGIRVGEYFIEEFMKQLERGRSFKAAFNFATELTETFTRTSDNQTNSNQFFDPAAQHPLLDDNGDMIGSNLLEDTSDPALDGVVADELFLGVGVSITNSALNPADLINLSETSFVEVGSNSLTLSAEVAPPNNNGDVSAAWFEVRKPNKVLVAQGGSIQLEVDLDKVLMTPDAGTGRWEGTYNGFVDSGLYEIFYYAKDNETGLISPTKRSVVYKKESGNLPPTTVTLLSPVDALSPGAENQKTIIVFDWTDATDPDGDLLTYTLEIATDASFAAGSVIQKIEELQSSGAIIDDSTPVPDSSTLYWRVTAIDQSGATSISATNSFVTDNTNGVPGIIQGLVYSNLDFGRLLGANVTTSLPGASVAITEFNGEYILLSDAGEGITLTVTSDSGEFDPQEVAGISVKAGKSSEVNIGISVGTVETDNVAPVITLTGSSALTINLGSSYSDEGATADDDVDGDISAQILITGIVDTTTAGVYTLTFNVSDAAGNPALPVTREVTVVDFGTLDTDDDGMPDVFEDANGLDKNNPDDADTDLDGDGLSNLEEYLGGTDISVDQVPPVFTAPDDLTLNATGFLTAVNLDPISVPDVKDGPLSATADITGPFTSGMHVITWSVSDLAGNSVEDVQFISINPLVELDADRVVGEGSTIQVLFTLTGEAVTYPVTVNYSIDELSTSDTSDHDAVAGAVIIDSGVEGSIEINIVDDGVGEGSETLIIALESASNAAISDDNTQTLTLVEGNSPPVATLEVTQDGIKTLILTQSGGSVIISSAVNDPNADEVFSYDWTLTNNNLSDTDLDDHSFTFNPSLVEPGLYDITLIVEDSGSLSTQVTQWVRVVETPLTLSDTADSDGDGEIDSDEGTGDSDGDGIPNYLDNSSQPANVLALPDDRIMQTEAGLSLTLGANAFGGEQSTATTTIADIESYGGSASGISTVDDGFTALTEIFDFSVEGLAQPGDTVTIVISLGQVLPGDSVYRKFLPDQGWVTFVAENGYQIMSGLSESGVCPEITSSSYTDGLTAGDDCLKLTLVDGGIYDGDGGIENGVVEDPGVIAVVTTESPVLNTIPNISIEEDAELHLNDSDSDLISYVTDPDTDISSIQFSIVNANAIDARFGLSIGMDGTDFKDRTDNSIHAHPATGFTGNTQVQVQAKDDKGNLSNVISFTFTINAKQVATSSGGGGGVIDVITLIFGLMLWMFILNVSRKGIIKH